MSTKKKTDKITFTGNVRKILAEHKPPRGATHFRFTNSNSKYKPVIDKITNISVLDGCEGWLEYGSVTYDGRGRHAKVKSFTPIATTSAAATTPASTPAPVPATPAAATDTKTPTSKARKNKIHGFSACAVAKALGQAGVMYAEGDKILRAHGIEMPRNSLSVQLGFGRNPASWERHGNPAPLSPGQIAELRAVAAA